MILTKCAVYKKTASVYRNFINSGNLSKNKYDFRQYGEKLFPLSTCWCHNATIRTKHILMLGSDRIAVYLSTACYPIASDFLLSVLQNILEFSMLLPFLLRQKQGDFREKFFTKGSSSCHTEGRNLMGRKDTLSTEYLSDNARFADICNYCLFDGQDVIRAEDLREMDTKEFLELAGLSGRGQQIQRIRDILSGLFWKSSSIRTVSRRWNRSLPARRHCTI